MPHILQGLPVHDARKFRWEGQRGVAEASDLLPSRLHGQVWADSCDVGFRLRSPRKESELVFTFESEERREGDLVSTTYRAYDPAGRSPLTVTVLND